MSKEETILEFVNAVREVTRGLDFVYKDHKDAYDEE